MQIKRKINQVESVECVIEIHEKCKVYIVQSVESLEPLPIYSNIIREKFTQVLAVNSIGDEIATLTQENSQEDSLQQNECNNPLYFINLNIENIYQDLKQLSKDKMNKAQLKMVNHILRSLDMNNCEFYKYNFTSNSDSLINQFNKPIDINENLYRVYQNCLVRDMESEFVPNPNKDYTSQLTILFRNELIKYLHLLGRELQISYRTLELAIVIFDRYYDLCHSFQFQIIQLIGASCLLIACKYDGEFQCPSIEEMNYSLNNQFTKRDFIQMEREILSTLNYQIPNVTCWDFIDIFLLVILESYKGCKNFEEIENHYYKLINHTLLMSHFNFDIRRCSKSSLACAVISIVRSSIGIRPLWKKSLVQVSNYSLQDFYFEYKLLSAIIKDNCHHSIEKFIPTPSIVLEILLADIDF